MYLPSGYVGGTAGYPVIYAHDGQNLFDPNAAYGGWQLGTTLDAMIAGAQMQAVIVVGVANMGTQRVYEYTHVPLSGSEGGAAAYRDFLWSDLKPIIDGVYRTLPDRDHTALLGSSPRPVSSRSTSPSRTRAESGRVAAMFSSFWWGETLRPSQTMLDIVTAAGQQDLILYIDSGGVGPSDPSDDNYGVTEDMKLLLESQGYTHGVDLAHWWEPNAPHNEASWAVRVHRPLAFLFPAVAG